MGGSYEFEKEDCLCIDGLKVRYEYEPEDPGRKPGPDKYAKYGDPGYPPEPAKVNLQVIEYEGVDITPVISELDHWFGRRIDQVKVAYAPELKKHKSLPNKPLWDRLEEELMEDAREKLKEE